MTQTSSSLPIIITIHDARKDVLNVPSQICSMPLIDHEADAVLTMKTVMTELGSAAMGISAVQVGVPRRIFVLRMPNGELKTFINPTIDRVSSSKTNKLEGCLSVPGSNFKILRPQNLTLSYATPDGTQETKVFTGIYARAVCHEIDHLNGKLITAYLNVYATKVSRKLGVRMIERTKILQRNRAKAKRARKSRQQNRHR